MSGARRGLEARRPSESAIASTLSDEAATRCPRCGHHFSGEGRFCAFDGQPLVRSSEWGSLEDGLLGQLIDQRYLIDAVIGEGGMGRVYRVMHVLLEKPFALKALRADLASDREIAARFIHEARIAASVSHPGLVKICDFGQLPTGQAYFVMELLEGAPLSLLLRHGALPVERALEIARNIAQALGAVHDAGIVHRDLKPDNIHLDPGEGANSVKIVDFGLAKVIGGTSWTRQGVVFGTPHYMSPEQAAGEPLDQRSDIYALGVVLYEMITGSVPFEADTFTGVLTKHIYMKPLPPSQRLPARVEPGFIEDLVLRCLEKRPSARFETLREFVAALDSHSVSAPPPAVGAEPLLPFSEGEALFGNPVAKKRARARAFFVALGLLASAGLGAWMFWKTAPRPAVSPTSSAARSAARPQLQRTSGSVSSIRSSSVVVPGAEPSRRARVDVRPIRKPADGQVPSAPGAAITTPAAGLVRPPLASKRVRGLSASPVVDPVTDIIYPWPSEPAPIPEKSTRRP